MSQDIGREFATRQGKFGQLGHLHCAGQSRHGVHESINTKLGISRAFLIGCHNEDFIGFSKGQFAAFIYLVINNHQFKTIELGQRVTGRQVSGPETARRLRLSLAYPISQTRGDISTLVHANN
ncbi:hypothetical protein [Alcaligenes parafaecalis]|uniref:Uncharacterized protein n=1 Tax=Alcaligenes parafaecalis TaxID=171260 RepID=A0ABT3VQU0_9BURK|nr:hypothetical protein [Alcaligenes parafaecalis]MCX5465921.1 hypothetical protein [Alcaligenes parafaecalis]